MSLIATSFWGSKAGLLVILAIVYTAVFLLVTMLVGNRERRRRDESLAQRFGRWRTHEDKKEDREASSTQWVPTSFAEFGQRFAMATGFSERLDERLERAGLPMLSGEFVALTAIAALAGAVFSALLLQNVIFILLIAGACAVIPWFWVSRATQKRLKAFTEQLADTLSILASSLRAGYSFLQALDTVSKEIGEPSAHEFQRVVAEIRLGRPIEDALVALATRIQSEDLKWAVIAINVQRQVGGNLAEVLDIVANTVRERAYIRRQVRVLSAEGRLSVGILAALPFFVAMYLAVVNPGYLSLLFTTTIGMVMLIAGGVLMTAGIFIMSRIVKIDV